MLSLYCSGPAAGGGHEASVAPQVATGAVLIEPERIMPHVRVEVFE